MGRAPPSVPPKPDPISFIQSFLGILTCLFNFNDRWGKRNVGVCFLLNSVKNFARSLTCHLERLDVTDPAESYSLLLLGFKTVGKRGHAGRTHNKAQDTHGEAPTWGRTDRNHHTHPHGKSQRNDDTIRAHITHAFLPSISDHTVPGFGRVFFFQGYLSFCFPPLNTLEADGLMIYNPK